MALYEAGYNNASWRTQMQGSTDASARFRNNIYFPYAASRVAEADQIAGLPQGVTPGLYGMPQATPRAPRPPAQPTLASYYKKSYDEYKKKSEQNNADVLRGYDDQRAETLALLLGDQNGLSQPITGVASAGSGGGGPSMTSVAGGTTGGIGLPGAVGFGGGPPTEAEIQLQMGRRAADARMVEQGISSSTQGDEQRAMFDRAKVNLDWNKKLDLLRLLQGTSNNKLTTMENTRFVPPDTGPLLAAEQMRGAGTTEGLPSPGAVSDFGGPSPVYGNPYGMLPEQRQYQQPMYGVGYGQSPQQTEKNLRRMYSYKVSRGEVPAGGTPVPLRPPVSRPTVPVQAKPVPLNYGRDLWRRATAPLYG